ncbi:MAG: hypothetical protein AAGN66_08645 [Acidobacteriota bacterium]
MPSVGWRIAAFGGVIVSGLIPALYTTTLWAYFPYKFARLLSSYPDFLSVYRLGALCLGSAGLGGFCIGLAFLVINSQARSLNKPPGNLLAAASEFFSRRVRTEVLEPTLRDMLDEHIEALAEFHATGRNLYLWKARIVVARGYWSFGTVVIAQTPLSFAKWILKLWKAV